MATYEEAQQWLKTQGLECDPYEHITWSIGIDDDFICFDHAIGNDGQTLLMATINSETGAFIENLAAEFAPSGQEALWTAYRIIDKAHDTINEWLADGTEYEEYTDQGENWLMALCNDLHQQGFPGLLANGKPATGPRFYLT